MLVANPLVGARPVEPVSAAVDEIPVPAGVEDPPLLGTPGDDGLAVVMPDPVGPALLKGKPG